MYAHTHTHTHTSNKPPSFHLPLSAGSPSEAGQSRPAHCGTPGGRSDTWPAAETGSPGPRSQSLGDCGGTALGWASAPRCLCRAAGRNRCSAPTTARGRNHTHEVMKKVARLCMVVQCRWMYMEKGEGGGGGEIRGVKLKNPGQRWEGVRRDSICCSCWECW